MGYDLKNYIGDVATVWLCTVWSLRNMGYGLRIKNRFNVFYTLLVLVAKILYDKLNYERD